MAFGKRKRSPRRPPSRKKRRFRGLVPRRILRRRRGRVHPSRRNRVKKSNLEVKFHQHAVRADQLGAHAGSAAFGPSNSLTLLAGLFGGNFGDPGDVTTGLIPGTGCTDIIGCWTTPAYPTSMKLDISYKQLTYVTGEPYPNPNLRILHGFYKNTGDKMNADLTTTASWITSIREALLRELFDSDYDADFLAYTKKSRNIRILSDKLIRPRKSVAVQVAQGFDPAGQVAADGVGIVAPDSHLSYKWPHSKHKSRMELSHQAVSGDDRMVAHNSWVPFLLMLVPGITSAGHGYLSVRSVTKAYFHDA